MQKRLIAGVSNFMLGRYRGLQSVLELTEHGSKPQEIKPWFKSTQEAITYETLISYYDLREGYVQFKDENKRTKKTQKRKEFDEWFRVLAADENLYTFTRDSLKMEEDDKIQEANMWKARREYLESKYSNKSKR